MKLLGQYPKRKIAIALLVMPYVFAGASVASIALWVAYCLLASIVVQKAFEIARGRAVPNDDLRRTAHQYGLASMPDEDLAAVISGQLAALRDFEETRKSFKRVGKPSDELAALIAQQRAEISALEARLAKMKLPEPIQSPMIAFALQQSKGANPFLQTNAVRLPADPVSHANIGPRILN